MSEQYRALRFGGALDIARYPEIHDAFLSVPATMPVLIDLTRAESADSTFLSEMLMFRRRHGAPVAIVVPTTGDLPRIFRIVNLSSKMELFTDTAAAVAALGAASADEGESDPQVAP